MDINGGPVDQIVASALAISTDGCTDINTVLSDVQDSTLSTSDTVPKEYGVNLQADLNISSAAGAMVVDDLMQKISTKVQVAAQLLSTANNINKTASRIMSQG